MAEKRSEEVGRHEMGFLVLFKTHQERKGNFVVSIDFVGHFDHTFLIPREIRFFSRPFN